MSDVKVIVLIWHTLKRWLIIGVYAQGDNQYKVNVSKVLDSILGISVGYSIFFSPLRKIPKYLPKIFHSHFITRNYITFLYMLHKRSCHTDGEAATTVVIEYFPIWNKVKWQLNAKRQFYWCILSSTCFGYIRPSSGEFDVELQHMVFCTKDLDGWWSWEPLRRSCLRCGMCRTAPSAPYTRPKQRLSRPPPFQNLGAENRMLQLNIECSWWWTYVPEICRAKNTSIKLPSCIKLAFHFISSNS